MGVIPLELIKRGRG
jgi:hypothetical protein